MEYGIALGSNLGDRLGVLREAVALMRGAGVAVLAASRVYETEPVDCPEGSGAFLNAVVVGDSLLEPRALLRELQGIEVRLGRPSGHGFHEPRTVDLDILYAGERVVREDGLELPHPRLGERRFVLEPLADVRPGLVLPGFELSVGELLRRLTSDEPPLRVVAGAAELLAP
jgi:2-amino-4-hydroxy-6-hydroxymethyldihydropteridine diphosphokinase